MKNKVFIDNKVFQKFNHEGYLKIPLLSFETVDRILSYYNSLTINNLTNCLAANIVLSEEENNEINEYIIKETMKPLKEYFKDFELHGGTFSVKKIHHPELELHQDTTCVDIEKDISYLIWIPLQNINKENGAMFLIPHSHNFFKNYISYTLPSFLIDRRLLLDTYYKTIDMNAGEALIFPSSLYMVHLKIN